MVRKGFMLIINICAINIYADTVSCEKYSQQFYFASATKLNSLLGTAKLYAVADNS